MSFLSNFPLCGTNFFFSNVKKMIKTCDPKKITFLTLSSKIAKKKKFLIFQKKIKYLTSILVSSSKRLDYIFQNGLIPPPRVFNWPNNPGSLRLKNDYLPVQKCPPNPGLHSSHLPFLSHTFSFRLLPHLHFDSQRSPKKPGLHRPPIFNIKKLYMYTVKSGNSKLWGFFANYF